MDTPVENGTKGCVGVDPSKKCTLERNLSCIKRSERRKSDPVDNQQPSAISNHLTIGDDVIGVGGFSRRKNWGAFLVLLVKAIP